MLCSILEYLSLIQHSSSWLLLPAVTDLGRHKQSSRSFEAWLLVAALSSPSHDGHLDSEPADDGISLLVSMFLSLLSNCIKVKKEVDFHLRSFSSGIGFSNMSLSLEEESISWDGRLQVLGLQGLMRESYHWNIPKVLSALKALHRSIC